MARARKYPEELLERATRLVFESGSPIAHVGRDLGIAAETPRKYVCRVEPDEGRRKDLLSSEEREEIKKLRRENHELRRANEILKAASVFFAASSIHTVRSERVHRGAPRALRGRADLPDSGRVGVRLLRACHRSALSALASRTSGCSPGSPRSTGPTTGLWLPQDVEGAAALRRECRA